jgi:hypothetical protein
MNTVYRISIASVFQNSYATVISYRDHFEMRQTPKPYTA